MAATCPRFVAHAFQPGKCRDCKRPLEAHADATAAAAAGPSSSSSSPQPQPPPRPAPSVFAGQPRPAATLRAPLSPQPPAAGPAMPRRLSSGDAAETVAGESAGAVPASAPPYAAAQSLLLSGLPPPPSRAALPPPPRREQPQPQPAPAPAAARPPLPPNHPPPSAELAGQAQRQTAAPPPPPRSGSQISIASSIASAAAVAMPQPPTAAPRALSDDDEEGGDEESASLLRGAAKRSSLTVSGPAAAPSSSSASASAAAVAAAPPAPPPRRYPAFSFASRLIHKYPLVREQASAGLYTLKRVRGFFKRYCALQRQFSASLEALVAEERAKLDAVHNPDRMATAWRTWVAILGGMGDIARAHQSYASEATLDIFEPLDMWHRMGQARVRVIDSELARSEAEMRSAADLEREREHCLKLIAQWQTRQRELVESGQPGPSHEVEEARLRALHACEAYDLAQRAAHQRREGFYTRDLPAALDDLQALEEARVAALHAHMERFVNLQSQFQAHFKEASDGVRALVTALKPGEDIEYFLRHCNSVHGAPPEWRPYRYDLPVPLAQLQLENFVNPHAVAFNASIGDILAAQAQSDPVDFYQGVPRLLVELANALERLGGLEAEGIFRVSASQRELQELRVQLVQGVYEFASATSPHVVAGLMKLWLRNLREPLVPFELYDEAVAIGRSAGEPPASRLAAANAAAAGAAAVSAPPPLPAAAAAARAASPPPAPPPPPLSEDESKEAAARLLPRVQAVVARVPAVVRPTLQFLVRLLRRVAAKQAVNRMSASNLAVVFAPSFLRDPNDDPHVMFRDAQAAAQFVGLLIELEALELAPPVQQAPMRRALSVTGIPIISLAEAKRRAQAQPELDMK